MNTRAIKRRIIAAILLYGFAIGSVLFWREGQFDPVMLAINVGVASLGIVFLHFKWRRREVPVSPKKVKDIFS